MVPMGSPGWTGQWLAGVRRPVGDRMRLVLGDQDLVLGVGEAAEFDTRVPHWFGSAGDGPAEVLSIFGRAGRTHAGACRGGDETGPHQDPHQ